MEMDKAIQVQFQDEAAMGKTVGQMEFFGMATGLGEGKL